MYCSLAFCFLSSYDWLLFFLVDFTFCDFFFFFNDTATTEIYTLSLHDALPISRPNSTGRCARRRRACGRSARSKRDRKSTRLNSSHTVISYAVFCLKKKKKKREKPRTDHKPPPHAHTPLTNSTHIWTSEGR